MYQVLLGHIFLQPDSAGVQCLILAGCLTMSHSPNPVKVQPFPMLRRLQVGLSEIWKALLTLAN